MKTLWSASTANQPVEGSETSAPCGQWPFHSEDEIKAAAAVLQSGRVNYWTGEHGKAFECEFAEYCGARFGVAMSNGTVALEIALRALEVGPGDDVVVTARSFVASGSVIAACGARPVFADVDADSQNVTVDTIAAAMTPRTRAVIAVHLAGWPCDMNSIVSFCKDRGVQVVEDCAQAHGATLDGRRVGSFGTAAAFSFCTDKIMSTGGEGGMLLTSDESVWRSAWSLKDHGKSWDAMQRPAAGKGYRWVHAEIGTNARLTEMQAAIGRLQLQKLDEWLAIRRRNAGILMESLSSVPALRVPEPPENVGHAWYKFYCFIRPEALKSGWSRDRVLSEVNRREVQCFSGSCPEIYLEKALARPEWQPADRLKVARQLGETSLMLLVDPCQSPEKIERNGAVLKQVLSEATR